MKSVHIALTSSQQREEPLYVLHSGYLSSVHRAGALPAVVCPWPRAAIGGRVLMERFDGLILTGGVDVHPRQFGSQPQPGIGLVCPERDEFELALARWALEHGFPVLGICRGAQVLNVAAGGTLHQDLNTLKREAAVAHQQTAESSVEWHEARLAEGTLLKSVVPPKMAPGGVLPVNSLHHQSVDRVADGWIVSAVAPDGVVEAIEKPGPAFALGVQWHPERMVSHGFVFHALVEAARRWRADAIG